MNTTAIKLQRGEHITFADMNFIFLGYDEAGNYLCILANPIDGREMEFDKNNCNDWRKSSLRKYLNEEFIKRIGKDVLVPIESDLTADNGDRSYGTCEDLIALSSCDTYREFRDVIPLFNEWMWTCTPWSCDPSSAYGVRIVNTSGIISSYYARDECGVAPLVKFSSENLELCRQAHLVRVNNDD